MPGCWVTRRRTSCCRELPFMPGPSLSRALRDLRRTRAGAPAGDGFTVPLLLPSSRVDLPGRAFVFERREPPWLLAGEAGRFVSGAGRCALRSRPSRWATCSSSRYSSTSGSSSRSRSATRCSAVRNWSRTESLVSMSVGLGLPRSSKVCASFATKVLQPPARPEWTTSGGQARQVLFSTDPRPTMSGLPDAQTTAKRRAGSCLFPLDRG